MSQIDINNVLAQIRSISAQAKLGHGPGAVGNANAIGNPAALGPGAVGKSGAAEFANLLRQGIDQVNQTQQGADALATAFQKGTPGVELPQVMLEMQKASVSFRAVTEVRNRLVNAYQEIMNMPI
jgi:flagellar hook-basal body complex protein FliE